MNCPFTQIFSFYLPINLLDMCKLYYRCIIEMVKGTVVLYSMNY